METNLGSLFIVTIIFLGFTVWLLIQLYKHDHPSEKSKKDSDYWS